MATEVAELVARLRADSTGMAQGLTVARTEMKATEAQAIGLGSTLSALSRGMGDFGIPFAGAVGRLETQVAGTSLRVSGGLTSMLATAEKVGTGLALAFTVAAVEGIHFADQFEVSHAQLETSLEKLGTTAEEQQVAINKTDTSMEHLGYTYAQSEHSLSRLVTATGSVAAAQQGVAAATDVARAKGMDLATATELLVKVEAGHYTLLGRQLGLSKEVINTFHNSGDAVAYLMAKMGGQAAAYADTFAGKLSSTKVKAEDLGVELGQAVIPTVEHLADAFVTIAHDMGVANDITDGWLGRIALIGTVGLIALSGVRKIASGVQGVTSMFAGAGGGAAAAGTGAEAGAAASAAAANNELAIASGRAAEMLAAEGASAATATPEILGLAAAQRVLGETTTTSAGLIVPAGAATAAAGEEAAGGIGAASTAGLGFGVAAGVAAGAAVLLGAVWYASGREARQTAAEVKELTKTIELYGSATPTQQAQAFIEIDKQIRSASDALREFERERSIAAAQAANPTNSQIFKSQVGLDPNIANTEKLDELHKALQKVISDQGALAAKPFFDRFLTDVAKIPGAAGAIGHKFDDIAAGIKAAQDEITRATSNAAAGIGVSASVYNRFLDMLPDGVQLSADTEAAWVQAANAATLMGLNAQVAAKDIADGMDMATIHVIILADSMTAAVQVQTGVDQLSKSVDELSTSMGGRGLIQSAGGGGKAVKTAAQQMVDAWSKANALRDANEALADSYEAVDKASMDAERAVQDMGVATRDVKRAQEDAVTASRDQATALKNFNDIVHGYAAGSKEGESATKAHRDALLHLQQSQLALTAAQKNLNDVQQKAGHTTADVQAAQVALIQAQYDVSDATETFNQSTKDLDQTLHGHAAATTQAQDAADQLRAANRRVEDSAVAVRSAVRNQQDAFVRIIDTSKAFTRAQEDVKTKQQDVTKATLDLQGKLTSASGAMGALRKKSDDAKIALDGVESNVLSLATTIANNTADKKKNPAEWAKAFVGSLQVLQNFLHPSGALAQFFVDMISKAQTLFNTLEHAAIAPPVHASVGNQATVSAHGRVATRPTLTWIAEAGSAEAVLPLGAGQGADRKRIMAQAMAIAPDLASYGGGGAGSVGGMGMGGSGDQYYIGEMHNHLIRNDRDLVDRLASLGGTLGRGVTVTRG